MAEEISYKTKEGEWKTKKLSHYQRITSLTCPVDETSLIETNGEDIFYTGCLNCGRHYHASKDPKDDCTQEKVNKVYREEIAKTKNSLVVLNEDYRINRSRLESKLAELKNTFTQDE